METETLAMAQEADFTLIALFFRATIIVQLVMIALIVASVYVWAITFSKYNLYRRARANAQAFDAAFWSGEPLDELYDQVAAGTRQRVGTGVRRWHDRMASVPS
jgi:biopolymer transport protein TolQ